MSNRPTVDTILSIILLIAAAAALPSKIMMTP
jgi:hypothetical protein